MFLKKATAAPAPRPTIAERQRAGALIAATSAASSSSSSSNAMNDIPGGGAFDLSRLRADGLPVKPLRPRRTLAPPNADWPEMDFLEEKSQSAFESQLDSLWLENNADFHYCDMHQQVCEMIANHPEDFYNPECQKCLKPTKGNIMSMFFHGEGASLNIVQARAAWYAYHNRKKEVYDNLRQAPAQNRELQKQFDLRERAAFLRYYFLAWEKNRARVKAIRENGKNPGESAAFNMLPPTADDDLSNFVRDASIRNNQTGAGMQGKSCNVKLCDMHEGSSGHIVCAFNKFRYHECGICVRTREESQVQRAADTYDRAAPAEERPEFRFETKKQGAGWKVNRGGGGSSAGGAGASSMS